MPSLVATIRPTSVATRLASKSFSRSLMTSEISFVLIPTWFFPLGCVRQAAAQLLQLGGDARVDQVVAVLELEAPQDRLVDDDRHPNFLAQPLGQLFCN